MGSSSNLTIAVVSASIGDVIYVKNGVYRESLPLKVPAGVTVQGESLRGTEVRPATSTGTQVKTILLQQMLVALLMLLIIMYIKKVQTEVEQVLLLML